MNFQQYPKAEGLSADPKTLEWFLQQAVTGTVEIAFK
jgi:hypothetical protein